MTQRTRKVLWLIVRILVSTVCVAWVAHNVQWTNRLDATTGEIVSRGFLSTLGDVFGKHGWPWLLAAAAVYSLSPLFGALRWRMLLGVQGIRLSLAEAWRLTYIGFFYNTFLLGLTGGDVVKAYYAAKHTDKKTEAVTTVFLDRLIGIFGMGLLCICALAFRWTDPALADVRTIILVFLGGAAVVGIVAFSRRVRRVLHIDALVERLPFKGVMTKLNAAVFVYRDHHRAVLCGILLSWCAHVVSIAAVYFSARALGLEAAPHYFLIYMPVIWIAAAVIPTIQGVGTMEWLCQQFFTAAVLGLDEDQHAKSEALLIMLLFRVAMFIAVLPGGVLHVLHPEVSAREAREHLKDETESDA
jgi:glycosyltransferase 2 family protein